MAEKKTTDHLTQGGGVPPESAAPPRPPLPAPYIFDFENPKPTHYHVEGIPLPEEEDPRIKAMDAPRTTRVKKQERAMKRRASCPEVFRDMMHSPASLNDKQLKSAVYKVIDSNVENAAQKIVDLLDCEDKRVALHAAMALLDRRFGKPEQMRKVESMNLTKTVVVIRDEADEADDDAIDVTPEGE